MLLHYHSCGGDIYRGLLYFSLYPTVEHARNGARQAQMTIRGAGAIHTRLLARLFSLCSQVTLTSTEDGQQELHVRGTHGRWPKMP